MDPNRTILLHTCRSKDGLFVVDSLKAGERYYSIDDKEKVFRHLTPKCNCRKRISLQEAQNYIDEGKAQYLYKRKNGKLMRLDDRDDMSKCTAIVAHVERGQTPRIDMITAADIQRAVIGSEIKTKSFVYNRNKKKFVQVKTIPEGFTLRGVLEAAEAEKQFENRIRKHYREYIRMSHELAMEFRKKLIVPFQEDPQPGRLLFPFQTDQRTLGGYAVDEISLDNSDIS